MSSLLLYRALPFACTTAPNLATADPKEVVAFSVASEFYLDFGGSVTLDSFFAGYFSPIANGGYIASVQTATGQGTGLSAGLALVGGTPAALAVQGRRRSHFVRLATPATSRWWRVVLTPAGATSVGVIAAGLAVQPAFGHEWGAGRQPVDLSTVSQLRGGGFGIERGARMSAWRFSCGDLTDAETQTLWAMAEEVGESAPVVVCEDPDYTAGLNERLHYGLFDSPEAYERQVPGATRWSFRVRQWV